MFKAYYKIIYTLDSPLSIGCNDNKNSDHDVLRDKRGVPFMPATSLCGVYRSYFDADKANNIFGSIGANARDTQLKAYDAYLDSDYAITVRDNNKLCIDFERDRSNKFDIEILEVGSRFVGYIELEDEKYENDIEQMLSAIANGDLRFGAKTSRGFGKMHIDVQKMVFKDKLDEWLDFDMYSGGCWENAEKLDLLNIKYKNSYSTIVLDLKVVDGISVREYTTDTLDVTINGKNKKFTEVDYAQLKSRAIDEEHRDKAVIPASSWAGAFREQYKRLNGWAGNFDDFDASIMTNIKALFGFADKSLKQKSNIIFTDSYIDGATNKQITRIAIDRFSGAAKKGALYKEFASYYGTTKLEIKINNKCIKNDKIIAPFVACMFDLAKGFMNVGGLGSIGRGIFEITGATINSVNVIDMFNDGNIQGVLELLKGGANND